MQRIQEENAVKAMKEFIEYTATIDDLAKLMSYFIHDGPVVVVHRNGSESDVHIDGKPQRG